MKMINSMRILVFNCNVYGFYQDSSIMLMVEGGRGYGILGTNFWWFTFRGLLSCCRRDMRNHITKLWRGVKCASVQWKQKKDSYMIISKYNWELDLQLSKDNCKNRSEYIEKAVTFYNGYLSTQDHMTYLPLAINSALAGVVDTS